MNAEQAKQAANEAEENNDPNFSDEYRKIQTEICKAAYTGSLSCAIKDDNIPTETLRLLLRKLQSEGFGIKPLCHNELLVSWE